MPIKSLVHRPVLVLLYYWYTCNGSSHEIAYYLVTIISHMLIYFSYADPFLFYSIIDMLVMDHHVKLHVNWSHSFLICKSIFIHSYIRLCGIQDRKLLRPFFSFKTKQVNTLIKVVWLRDFLFHQVKLVASLDKEVM